MVAAIKKTILLIIDFNLRSSFSGMDVFLESKKDLTNDFITAMKGHRVWEREKPRKVPA